MRSSKSKPQTGGRPVPRAEMLWCLLAMFVGSFEEPRPGRIQKVDPFIWEPLLLEGTLWNHPSGIYYNLGTSITRGYFRISFWILPEVKDVGGANLPEGVLQEQQPPVLHTLP